MQVILRDLFYPDLQLHQLDLTLDVLVWPPRIVMHCFIFIFINAL